MFSSGHAVAQAATQVPAYCTSGHGVLTPAQYSYCVHLGWNQSYSTPISNDLAGHGSGFGVPVIIAVIIVALYLMLRSRRSPVAARS